MNTELLHFTNSLAYLHLGMGFDLLKKSRAQAQEFLDQGQENPLWILSHRNAISSIIHLSLGLESMVNKIGFELFIDENSDKFLPPEQRDVPTQIGAACWDRSLGIVDKIRVLLAIKSATPGERLINELRELTHLRNMLVHGFCFGTTFLVEPNERGTLDVIDQEDSFEWTKKFSHTQFTTMDRLNHADAKSAASIVVETLKAICEVHSEPVLIVEYEGGVNSTLIYDKSSDTGQLLD